MNFKLNISGTAGQQFNPAKQSKSSRDVLYGTGITKKLIVADEKLAEKTIGQDSSITSEQKDVLAHEEFDALMQLPSSLMADDLILDEYQTTAVNGMVDEQFAVLIGAAGTGKTTTTKAFVNAIRDQVHQLQTQTLHTLAQNEKNENDKSVLPAIAFCAPTGKAAQQLKRALPKELHPLVSTIHKLLGFAPEWIEKDVQGADGAWITKEVRVFLPTFTANNKLPFKIIIIDEAGSVALSLWHMLLDACEPDVRIYQIGDLNQLPPVSGHSVLGFAMLSWPTFTLEKLHRQAEGNPIIENAHRILQGKKPITCSTTKNFIVKDIEGGSSVVKAQTLGIIKHLHENGRFDPLRDVLIVPQNKMEVGQLELNRVLVNYFNPTRTDENGKPINPRTVIVAGYDRKVFAVGDKVILLKNDNILGLTNGMMGIVTGIVCNNAYKGEKIVFAHDETSAGQELDLSTLDDLLELANGVAADEEEGDAALRQASHILKVKFQNVDEEVDFATAGAYTNLAFGYAITCHKAQGSEFENVVVLAHSVNQKMLCREWLYTAITRARKSVILLTNNRGLTYAVNNQRIKGATIKEKAEKFIALTKAARDEPAARLPTAKKIQTLTVTMKAGAK